MIKLRPPKQTVCPAPRQTMRSAVSWPCAFFAPPQKKNKKKKSPIPIADFPALLTRAAPFGDAAETGGAKPRCQARRNNAESARPNGAKPSTRQASVNRAPNPKAAPQAARACLARPSTAARQAWDRPHPPAKSSGDVGASPSKPRATKRRLIRIFGNIMPLPQRQSAASRAFLQRPRARPDRMLLAPPKRRAHRRPAPPPERK